MTLRIVRRLHGAPAREVPLDRNRLAALLATNDRQFPDEAALMRHLRRGRSVWMMLAEYRLRPEDQFRLVVA
ncbi:hypothetical protein LAZ29_11225 [Cereibacter sphaeroides]|uniref:hypothetical protein n=1 Tax=Cereibacter sphaeroides TaxID=1063 RepID=UPI001F451C3B|nr:hypothetical protein [Cereibacter sphaeroides]MCE6951503.1 hypothetical protein [Cereibacter sphaeroides]